jgi:hypothetical protein
VQDDFKVSRRVTVNAGLRYEVFRADTEVDNRLTNFDPVNLRLIYAGEDGASRSVNKKTQPGNLAPRLGLTYDLLGDGRTILRSGFGVTYFPVAGLRVESARAAGPVHDLAERLDRDEPARLQGACATIDDPFPPIAPGEAADDGS